MTDRLEGKSAVVVGGGQMAGQTVGIGRAVALLLAREGARVLVVDRSLDSAQDTVEMIEREGGRASPHQTDIVSGSECAALASTIRQGGGVDILVHNVGTDTGDDSSERISEDAWHRILDTNLTGMWLIARHIMPVMREGPGGSFIAISSIASFKNNADRVAYGVSKAGMDSLTRRLALDNAPHGIRVNGILPGMIDTPMGVDAIVRRKGGSRDEIVAARAATVPMGRQGTAWDVARAALFFACEDSTFVTGQLLVVDGGLTLIIGPVPENAR